MTWLASIGIGFLTAIIGAFGTGALGALCVDWYRIPGREGGSGYFVIFLGLLGGLIGFIIGVASARMVAAGAAPGFVKGFGVATGSSLGLLLIVLLICWLAADLDTTLRGNAVELNAEIRCPPGFVLPAEASEENWYAHIDTRRRRVTSRGALRVKEARQEEGRWIIPMTLVLKTSVREKLLYVRLAENTQLFIPVFPSKPGERYFAWSQWFDGGWEPGKPRPEAAQRFNLRFRLQLVPPAEPASPSPARSSEDEMRAKKEAEENATLAALTPDSPLEDSLKFTHYSQSEERRRKAGAVIGRRPEVVAEMSAQILSPDHDLADRALRALAFVKPLPAELAGPVAVIGDKVIAGLRKFNASKPEDDPGYQVAADVSVLFSGWFQAHHALHDFAGVDGRPQLEKILELSLQREDSHVMKDDVARVAKYYATEWSREPAVK